ncbi:MAG: hypothetical protein FWG59_00310, partial [Betaproteobacteria bacterium]|nr:hypothetical protein [Betaproteobacteria bacterium]
MSEECMVAKTTPAPDIDEDIIELTDIIEQGTPPTPDASVASMDDQLTDLLNAGAGGEAQDDLDALLAEIGTTPQAGTPNAGEQTGPHPVNPDETLDMPDMQEVENLLDELSIPPQPSALSDPAAAEQDVGSLDDILDQLGGAGQPATLAATPDPVDELDALLDGVTATSITSMPSDATPIEESNALPDKVPASSPTSPPATRKAKTSVTVTISPVATSSAPSVGAAPPKTSGTAAANSADDMDALLESATATAPAPPEISQSLSLADDLDASRESVPSAGPVPPIDEKPPSPPERTAPEADDAAPPTAPASSTVAPETAVIAEMPPLPHQWEALLGGASESSLPTQSSAPPPGAVPVSPDI